jgi:hypothetical protein
MYGPHGYITGLSIGAGFGVAFIVSLFIAAFFLSLAAKILGIRDAGLLRAVFAIVGGGVFAGFVLAVFGLVFPHGLFLGSILALIAYIWTIKVVFNTDWIRALLALVLALIIEAIVMGILVWILAILGIAAVAFMS